MPVLSARVSRFPYFFVGTFIEALVITVELVLGELFPYFFVGTFIEAPDVLEHVLYLEPISLLFRRDFH